MLLPDLIPQHKTIVQNAFLTTNQKDSSSTVFIRLYDINGYRISGIILGLDFNDLYIDALINEVWQDF